MISKRLLITITVLLVAQPTFAQFGSNNRLTDLAGRLSRETNDFADANYRSYTNSNRPSRNDVEAVLLSQQFGAATQIFYRMVVDRRRSSELRDAYDLLQTLSRSVERNNLQRSTWSNVQRLLQDLSREIGDSNDNPNPYPPDTGNRNGRMTWKGRVDDDIRVKIRGGSADVETIGGTPYYDAQPNFSSSLPNRRITVTLRKNKGRGDMFIEQQPSRENDFTAVIRIKDSKGGASDYEFEVNW
jgi:hypothetical protein